MKEISGIKVTEVVTRNVRYRGRVKDSYTVRFLLHWSHKKVFGFDSGCREITAYRKLRYHGDTIKWQQWINKSTGEYLANDIIKLLEAEIRKRDAVKGCDLDDYHFSWGALDKSTIAVIDGDAYIIDEWLEKEAEDAMEKARLDQERMERMLEADRSAFEMRMTFAKMKAKREAEENKQQQFIDLVKRKFTSGNNVEVDRITIKRDEVLFLLGGSE